MTTWRKTDVSCHFPFARHTHNATTLSDPVGEGHVRELCFPILRQQPKRTDVESSLRFRKGRTLFGAATGRELFERR